MQAWLSVRFQFARYVQLVSGCQAHSSWGNLGTCLWWQPHVGQFTQVQRYQTLYNPFWTSTIWTPLYCVKKTYGSTPLVSPRRRFDCKYCYLCSIILLQWINYTVGSQMLNYSLSELCKSCPDFSLVWTNYTWSFNGEMSLGVISGRKICTLPTARGKFKPGFRMLGKSQTTGDFIVINSWGSFKLQTCQPILYHYKQKRKGWRPLQYYCSSTSTIAISM